METKAQNRSNNNVEIFKGSVVRVSFRDMTSGFTIMKVCGDSNLETTVVGVVPKNIDSGSTILARGTWQTHPKFGKQFKVYSISEIEPTTSESIAKYLASSGVKGLGDVLAERIVEKFGDQTLSIIDNNPERLLEISGIGQNKLEQIIKTLEEKKNSRETYLFFINHGISSSLAQRICEAYGKKAVETVKENPYILAKSVWRIGFLTADKIAKSLGIKADAPERLKAGVVHTIRESTDSGHCYIPEDKCLEKSMKLLETDDYHAIKMAITGASLAGEIIIEDSKIYLPNLHQAELMLAKDIANRISKINRPEPNIPVQLVEAICLEPIPTADSGLSKLSVQQQEAIKMAANRHLSVITGGPGCGKTTVLKAITKLFRKAGLRLKLTAPTGRASQRLAEVCDLSASTIHRLLKYDPATQDFVHNRYNPLEADAFIIDESSMIDIQLAESLFQAIPKNARIVIVGDSDQLPSVGPGTFLSDLLEMETTPQIKLNQIFRREEESLINHIAHKVNIGSAPQIPALTNNPKGEAFFVEAQNIEEAADKIEKLVTNFIPNNLNISADNISVLTPMNQGELGVIALNQRLQNKLVPQMQGMPWLKVGNLEFRLGDKICQRVNNYNIHTNGVFNGEQGIVVGIDPASQSITAKLWDDREVTYTKENLNQIDLAYATSIHRSQGTEVPVVVMAIHETHFIMLERQLVYTGITRAKKLLILVGTRKALEISCKSNKSRKRYSDLGRRVTSELGKSN